MRVAEDTPSNFCVASSVASLRAFSFAVDFSVVWEPSALYFAARVSNASIDGGNATAGIFRNDSIELYLADDVLIGHAGPNDPQLIVDHANRAESYRVGFPSAAPMAAPLGFTSAVQKKGSTIVFELRVAASVLGMANLADGAKLGFDNAVNDGDGMTQRTQLIWYMAPTCSCTLGCCCGMARDEPYCNTQRYGSLTLAP